MIYNHQIKESDELSIINTVRHALGSFCCMDQTGKNLDFTLYHSHS